MPPLVVDEDVHDLVHAIAEVYDSVTISSILRCSLVSFFENHKSLATNDLLKSASRNAKKDLLELSRQREAKVKLSARGQSYPPAQPSAKASSTWTPRQDEVLTGAIVSCLFGSSHESLRFG